MVHRYMQDNGHWITIIHVILYGQKLMIMLRWALDQMVVL
jgi:hypothetical protein